MFTSEIVAYHQTNPDISFPGCQNTGIEGTDGVVFLGVETLRGSVCFIGRQSVMEAVGVMYGMTPDEVHKRLTAELPKSSRKRKEPVVE